MKNHKLKKINIYEEFLDGLTPEEAIEYIGKFMSPNMELLNPKFRCETGYDYYDEKRFEIWLEHWVPMTEMEIEKKKKNDAIAKVKKAEDDAKTEKYQRRQYEALKKKFEIGDVL